MFHAFVFDSCTSRPSRTILRKWAHWTRPALMPRREAAQKSSQKSKAHSQTSLVCQWEKPWPNWRNSAYVQNWPNESAKRQDSNQVLAIIGPEPNRFHLQIVPRSNETNRLDLCAHWDCMGGRRGAAV